MAGGKLDKGLDFRKIVIFAILAAVLSIIIRGYSFGFENQIDQLPEYCVP